MRAIEPNDDALEVGLEAQRVLATLAVQPVAPGAAGDPIRARVSPEDIVVRGADEVRDVAQSVLRATRLRRAAVHRVTVVLDAAGLRVHRPGRS